MIIGHGPSGYIAAHYLARWWSSAAVSRRWLLWAGIVGALAPDLDMIYFHWVDHRQHHHHTYVSHFPLLWFGLLILTVVWLRQQRVSQAATMAFVFAVGGCIHVLLDSIVGDIWWLAPFVDRSFSLFTVPALYQPWWLNFIWHWSFGLELLLWGWALCIWRQSRSQAADSV